jgi:hypothetical protein
VCLMAASVPASRLEFLREDMLDDLAHAEVLIGRDQDRRVLTQVFEAIARNRIAAERGLAPPSDATPAKGGRSKPARAKPRGDKAGAKAGPGSKGTRAKSKRRAR